MENNDVWTLFGQIIAIAFNRLIFYVEIQTCVSYQSDDNIYSF